MRLEQPDCPMCGHQQSTQRYTFPMQPFGVAQCDHCDMYFLSPRLPESDMLATYKKDTYFLGETTDARADGYHSYEAQEQALRLTFARLLKVMERRGLTGGSLLEVGCGYGYLLREAAPYFQLRHGTDFSAEAAERASAWANQIFTGVLDIIPPESQYDCVVTNHVIEHVYHPTQFLQSIWDKLKPGGNMLISTPHMGSWWRRFMGSRWPSFKLPEHVLYFDEAHLRKLVADCGFKNIHTIPYLHAFPMSLVAAKLGLSLPTAIGNISMWIPQTTLALQAQKPL